MTFKRAMTKRATAEPVTSMHTFMFTLGACLVGSAARCRQTQPAFATSTVNVVLADVLVCATHVQL